MNDRELLEYAAKAAGLELADFQNQSGALWLARGYANPSTGSRDWNPLTDDGDALRLAVKLGLDVFSRPAQWAECGRIGVAGCREHYNNDPYAATRRAIVRAAAEICKAMP